MGVYLVLLKNKFDFGYQSSDFGQSIVEDRSLIADCKI